MLIILYYNNSFNLNKDMEVIMANRRITRKPCSDKKSIRMMVQKQNQNK